MTYCHSKHALRRIALVLAGCSAAAVPVAADMPAGDCVRLMVRCFRQSGSSSSIDNLQRALNTTKDQRIAIGRCKDAADRVHKVAAQMVGPGTRWRYDADVFPRQEAQLRATLGELMTNHQQFRHALRSDQEMSLRTYLDRLDGLSAALTLRMEDLDRELSRSKPDGRVLYSDAHKIKELAEKWRSEHRKIAKYMDITF